MALSKAITIPVNSFSKVNPEKKRVVPDPDVGDRWGKESALQFGFPPDPEQPDDAVGGGGVRPKDEKHVVRAGTEVLTMLPGGEAASVFTFYCGSFVEKTEESKKNGGVIEKTRVFTTVFQYSQWSDAKYLFWSPARFYKVASWYNITWYW